MSSALVWVITGCSSGIGRELTIAALGRGHKVIATTRHKSFKDIEDLQTRGAYVMELDVTASLDELKEIASRAVGVYGKVDVVVNNAGFVLAGSVEETSHEDTVNQFNTNLFGAINVARAFLPYMREQKTGTVAFIGSLAGWRGCPFGGLYAATKYALRGISNSLHLEISPLGLRSICFELGCFYTQLAENRQRWTPSIDAYEQAGGIIEAWFEAFTENAMGDPKMASQKIVDVITEKGFAFGKSTPTSVPLGRDSYETIKKECEETLSCLEEWKHLISSTDYTS